MIYYAYEINSMLLTMFVLFIWIAGRITKEEALLIYYLAFTELGIDKNICLACTCLFQIAW